MGGGKTEGKRPLKSCCKVRDTNYYFNSSNVHCLILTHSCGHFQTTGSDVSKRGHGLHATPQTLLWHLSSSIRTTAEGK